MKGVLPMSVASTVCELFVPEKRQAEAKTEAANMPSVEITKVKAGKFRMLLNRSLGLLIRCLHQPQDYNLFILLYN